MPREQGQGLPQYHRGDARLLSTATRRREGAGADGLLLLLLLHARKQERVTVRIGERRTNHRPLLYTSG
jgi:hypothetical protein